MFLRHRFPILVLWAVVVSLALATPAFAYIGPGAGMEFLGYAMALVAMVAAALFSVLSWPFYAVMRWIRGTKAPAPAEPTPAAPPQAETPAAPPAPPAP
jgi:hypothetical protein